MSPSESTHTAIEPGTEAPDTSSLHDFLYDPENRSITHTLRSNWLRDRIKLENGRQYITSDVSNATYIPIDETQLDQLDLCHKIYTDALSIFVNREWIEGDPVTLYLSPIGDSPQRVLDIGTGTGLWAIDVGETHAATEVIGFDIAPVQPHWTPPNVQFEIEHLDNDWTYRTDSFDLVHARAMHAVITDFPTFVSRVFRIVQPGGFFEFHSETPRVCCDDGTVPHDWKLIQWLEYMQKGLNVLGLSMYCDDKIEGYMRNAGFTHVKQISYRVPIGPWAKDPRLKQLGSMFLVNLLVGIEGWSLTIFTKVLGWSLEDTTMFIADVKKSIRNKKLHAYMRFYNTIGQKPEIYETLQQIVL